MKKAICLLIVSATIYSCNDNDLEKAHYFTPAGPGNIKHVKDTAVKVDSSKIKSDGKVHF